MMAVHYEFLICTKNYDASVPFQPAKRSIRKTPKNAVYNAARPFHQAIAPSTKTTTMASLTIVV